MRIAMWSGPRNLSTAMMYSFAARTDFAVVDEPFYAAYLAATGVSHPMKSQILASQPTDPADVICRLKGSIRGNKPHFYQKHMTHHMVPEIPLEWMAEMVNVFLIRHPARVVASYARKREGAVLSDLGFERQAELYETAVAFGQDPVVIDSETIRANPERALRRLCAAIGLTWQPAMLNWPQGGHPDDGVWSAHWYGAVHTSKGFDGPEGELPRLEPKYAALAEAALPSYLKLHGKRLA